MINSWVSLVIRVYYSVLDNIIQISCVIIIVEIEQIDIGFNLDFSVSGFCIVC